MFLFWFLVDCKIIMLKLKTLDKKIQIFDKLTQWPIISKTAKSQDFFLIELVQYNIDRAMIVDSTNDM